MSVNLRMSPVSALRVRYYGPTESGRGSRFVVSDDRGRRVTVPFAYALSDRDRLIDAVDVWCRRYFPGCFDGSVVASSMSSTEWVVVFLPLGVEL